MQRSGSFVPLTERQYDAVIVGTGLPESILAAALACAGSKVLHLDPNGFYGGAWATLPLSQIDQLVDASVGYPTQNGSTVFEPNPLGTEVTQQIEKEFGTDYRLISLPNLPLHSQLFPDGVSRVKVEEGLSERILPEQKGSFWLDFIPRPIMAAGAMVDLLVLSNVGHYVDFRAIDGLYVEFGNPDGLQYVPGSRADVFQNKFITMLEKRLLMRFVKKCYDANENSDEDEERSAANAAVANEENRAFREEMSAMGLTEKLQQFLVHSIAFVTGKEESFSCADGVSAVRKYQQSLIRYGTNTPFLYPNYGTGELAQAFCRLCAVNGGMYVLRRGAASFVIRDENSPNLPNGGSRAGVRISDDYAAVGVVTAEQELVTCKTVFVSKHLAGDIDSLAPARNEHEDAKIWRLTAIIDGSIVRDATKKRIMITVPRGALGNNTSAVRIRQLDDTVMICPRSYFILYAETIEPGGSEQDVLSVCRRYVEIEPSIVPTSSDRHSTPHDRNGAATSEDATQLLEAENRPRLLWAISYSRSLESLEIAEKGIVLVSQESHDHDTDSVIAEAKRCFGVLHPIHEFFSVSQAETQTNGDISEFASSNERESAEESQLANGALERGISRETG